nr:lytic transglycosylase domain-containing protein [uncultured Brevundimonas sp.]
MVRLLITAVLMAAASGAAQAQVVNWSAAGGDLFGRAAVDEVEEAGAGNGEALPRLRPLDQPFLEAVAAAAEAHGLDPKLLHALVVTESAYRPNAISPVGASGLTQLMPATALELGVRNRFDPVENLRGGADYLARQILRFGDLRLALAAYNSGPARVASLGRIPRIRETEHYVESVVECFLALSAGRVVSNARQCRREGPP